MESRRHILPSNFSSQHTSLDSPVTRDRQPLTDSAGNAQLHTLASLGHHHDTKGYPPGLERSLYSMPTVPSQPARQPDGGSLGMRRQQQHNRRRRHVRYNRNPIVDSPQYQAYRARQNRDGNVDDLKWPQILEFAFLDALVDIPSMGRRKYSYHGKPHGRNELIKEYLWIAYLQSLPPGTRPDVGMMRTRKQVSSHIQVLKGFLRDHPAFHRLFPPKDLPRNGFEDSFKNDPCLKALSDGRLPNRSYDQYENINYLIASNHEPVRPVEFWLLMSSILNFRAGDMNNESAVAHKFTKLGTQKHREKLESVIGWRQKFPHLHHLETNGELNCDIIHMDANLNLLTAEPPPGSELLSQSILAIPGKQSNNCVWRMVTTLHKPPELYRDPVMDERLEDDISNVDVISQKEGETRIKASFPIFHWAHAFSRLVDVQAQFDEHQRSLQSYGASSEPSSRPARDYVEQVAMFQEVQSAAAPGMPFIRRAIIIWTFHQARDGQGNSTNWRYLDAPPARRMCMSPSPQPSHLASSNMNENFNSWNDTPLLLQQSMVDPFVQGLDTPPNSAGLQPAFGASPYHFSGSGFDLPVENLSFVSNSTVDSEVTLVDHDTSHNIDHLFSNVNMADYSQDASIWQLPATDNFDGDPAWAYNVPSSTPAIEWNDSHHPAFPELPESTQQTSWTDDTSSKHEYLTAPNSPSKQMSNIERSIEQKLLPWIEGHRDHHDEDSQSTLQNESQPWNTEGNRDHHDEDSQSTLQDASQTIEPLQEVDANAPLHTPKHDEWVDPADEFDYAALAERLK